MKSLSNNYQRCTKCVMDTSDKNIRFDGNGICNHCHGFSALKRDDWFPNKEGKKYLNSVINSS